MGLRLQHLEAIPGVCNSASEEVSHCRVACSLFPEFILVTSVVGSV